MKQYTPIGGCGVPKCMACVHYLVKDEDYPCSDCKYMYLKAEIREVD